MLRHKDTNGLSELKTVFDQSDFVADKLLEWLSFFKFSSAFKNLDSIKKTGHQASKLLALLVIVPFAGKASMYALLQSGYSSMSDAGKDTYYRFKNRNDISWDRLLHRFVMRFLKIIGKKAKSVKGRRCLIIDDTVLEKRGKKIEGVGKLWDHVTMRYVLGFKLLVLGYYDGKSFLPVDFSLHREKGKKTDKLYGLSEREHSQQRSTEREPDCAQHKRKAILDEDKISSAIRMVRRAVKILEVDYLLMDSWFTCQKVLECALDLSVNVIGMMKMGKTLYEYNSVNYTAAELLNKLKKKPKKCKLLRSSYIEVPVKLKDNEVTLFFSRFGKRGKWHVILCTDKKLGYRKMMELYQIRWSIEIFFKEAKQYLNLGKSQSEDFGGQIADITISMIQHILLTLKKRFGDYETRGEVFRQAGEQAIAFTLDQRLWKLCLELIQLVIEALELTVDSIEDLISKLVKNHEIERLLMQQKLPLVA